jgi:hypothetical protein
VVPLLGYAQSVGDDPMRYSSPTELSRFVGERMELVVAEVESMDVMMVAVGFVAFVDED